MQRDIGGWSHFLEKQAKKFTFIFIYNCVIIENGVERCMPSFYPVLWVRVAVKRKKNTS